MSEKTAFEKHSSHFPKCNVQCPSKFAPMLTDFALGRFEIWSNSERKHGCAHGALTESVQIG